MPRARINSPKPGISPVQNRTGGFRRHIPQGHARPSGGEDGGYAPGIRQGRQPPPDERGVVRNDFRDGHAPAQLLQRRRTAGPEASGRAPECAESLMVTTAASIMT